MNSTQNILEVSQLTAYIKATLEDDPILQEVEVQGEVANLTYHRSGHVYFTLKDAGAQISSVLFKTYALRSEKMEVGEQIIATGSISVYAPRGNYQLMVRKVRKTGKGDLFEQFIKIRNRLREEGLFDPHRKRSIPPYPSKIAVITSPTGAAIRDIIRTLSRRFPGLHIQLYPTTVQGHGGEESIVNSLHLAQSSAAEVIILGRGGGSMEDLWNFNEESVARAIADSQIPVITGIGHESDFTIADFVADFRASTPTAAAERAVPDQQALKEKLVALKSQIHHTLQHALDIKRQILDDYSHRIASAGRERLNHYRHTLELLSTQLEGLDTQRILQRGYTITLKEGKILKSGMDLSQADQLETVFADSRIVSRVEEVKTEE
ncbi:MAG: exodeoxyribonuclease VII large subunit [Bacteroidota bacterium]